MSKSPQHQDMGKLMLQTGYNDKAESSQCKVVFGRCWAGPGGWGRDITTTRGQAQRAELFGRGAAVSHWI